MKTLGAEIVNEIDARQRFSPEVWDSRFPLTNEIFKNESKGRLFHKKDQWVLALHRSGFGRLGFLGDPQNVIASFFDFVASEPTLPEYFHLYDFPQDYYRKLDEINFLAFRYRKRIKLKYSVDHPPEYIEEISTDVSLLDMQGSLSLAEVYAPFEQLILNFWSDIEEFKNKGIASILILDGSPVSLCYSAGIDGDSAEIDVFTLEEFRSKGFGRMVTTHFMEQCLEKGVNPLWDCFADNDASLQLARSVGFDDEGEYRFLSIFNPNK